MTSPPSQRTCSVSRSSTDHIFRLPLGRSSDPQITSRGGSACQWPVEQLNMLYTVRAAHADPHVNLSLCTGPGHRAAAERAVPGCGVQHRNDCGHGHDDTHARLLPVSSKPTYSSCESDSEADRFQLQGCCAEMLGQLHRVAPLTCVRQPPRMLSLPPLHWPWPERLSEKPHLTDGIFAFAAMSCLSPAGC